MIKLSEVDQERYNRFRENICELNNNQFKEFCMGWVDYFSLLDLVITEFENSSIDQQEKMIKEAKEVV